MRKSITMLMLSLGLGLVSASVTAATVDVATAQVAPNEGYKGATLFEDVAFLNGTGGMVYNIGELKQGAYQMTLTDFVFPNMFNELKVAVSTATQLVSVLSLDPEHSQAIEAFVLDHADSYYLSIYGSTSSGYGLYGVELAEFIASPVPVPGSLILLLSGLLAGGAFARNRKPELAA